MTGIDGTGKSTLARATVAELRRQGIPARYVYGRTWPLVSRALMAAGRALRLRGRDQWHDYDGYTTEKKRVMRSRPLALAYTASILGDSLVQVWLKLLPHRWNDAVVIADRYVYDTVISDLAVHLSYSTRQADRLIARCLRVVPRPDLTLLIDVPPEIAFSRKDDVPHVDYLRERREWYLRLASRPEVVRVDGLAAPDDLVARALAELAERGLAAEAA